MKVSLDASAPRTSTLLSLIHVCWTRWTQISTMTTATSGSSSVTRCNPFRPSRSNTPRLCLTATERHRWLHVRRLKVWSLPRARPPLLVTMTCISGPVRPKINLTPRHSTTITRMSLMQSPLSILRLPPSSPHLPSCVLRALRGSRAHLNQRQHPHPHHLPPKTTQSMNMASLSSRQRWHLATGRDEERRSLLHNALSTDSGLSLRDASSKSMKAYREREIKWLNIVSKMDAGAAKKDAKLKKLVRSGIPASVRSRVWQFLAGSPEYKKPNMYQVCTEWTLGGSIGGLIPSAESMRTFTDADI